MALRSVSLYEKVEVELLFPWGFADFVSLIHQQMERVVHRLLVPRSGCQNLAGGETVPFLTIDDCVR